MKNILIYLLLTSQAFASTYIAGPALIEGSGVITTAAGTTVLTLNSETNQVFTGTTTQNLQLPDATTLKPGRRFDIVNNSTGSITIKLNGGTTLYTVNATNSISVYLRTNSTTDGVWDKKSGSGGAAIGGPITGGTLGSIPFVAPAGTIAQDNSNLFWDSTNQRLGLGTVNPQAVVHVAATTGTSGQLLRIAAPSSYLHTSSGTDLGFEYVGAGKMLLNASASNSLFALGSTFTTAALGTGEKFTVNNGTSFTAAQEIMKVTSSGISARLGQPFLLENTAGSFSTSIFATPTLAAATRFQLPPTNGTSGYCLVTDGSGNTSWSATCGSGGGSVTSVALAAPAGGVFGVTGSPVTSNGTLTLTATGTSGGIPYFSSAANIASSSALSASGVVLGGGAGASPTSLVVGADGSVLKAEGSTTITSNYHGKTHNYIGNDFAEVGTSGWSPYTDVQSATVNPGASGTITLGNASPGSNTPFILTGSLGSLTGISLNTTYYLVVPTGLGSYNIALTAGGIPIAVTGSNTGASLIFKPLFPVVGGAGSTLTGLTFSRNTTTPLRAPGNFRLVQTNATSVAGQGVSYSFTADPADVPSTMEVDFDYKVTSTFVASSGAVGSESDVEVFIYDNTSQSLIPLSTRVITAVNNSYTFKGTFPTNPSSTSYRLVIHTSSASSNATGWTMDFTNVFVGNIAAAPNSKVVAMSANLGTAQAISASTVTTVNINTATADTTGSLNTTTHAFIAPVSGLYFISGQVGSAAVTNQLTAILQKNGASLTNGGTPSPAAASASNAASILVQLSANDSITMAAFSGSAITIQSGISTFLNVFLIPNGSSIPSALNTVGVILSGSTTAIATAVTTFLPTTIVRDTNGAFTAGTGVFQAPFSGWYQVSALYQAGSNTGTTVELYYKINAGASVLIGGQRAVAQGNMYASGSEAVYMTAGDSLVFQGSQNSGTGSQAPASFNASIIQWPGGAASGTAPIVSLRYTDTSGQAIANGTPTVLTNWTKDFDSTGSFIPTTGVFSVPYSGTYQICALITYASTTYATATNRIAQVLLSGTRTATLATTPVWAAITTYISGNGCTNGKYSAGDTISITASHALGGTVGLLTSGADNYMTIQRTGD